MPFSVKLIKKLESIDPTLREVLIAILEEVEKQREESVTKKEFLEFSKRTEQNFQRVWDAIEKLTDAQKKTEEKLTRLEATVEKLAEAQKKTEERLTGLEVTVQKLADAQRKTEERVNELAEAQKKTEERLNQLARAQEKTEEELRKLIGEHRKTREEIGGLSHSVGYLLEDRAYIALPKLLKRDMGIDISDIRRDFVEISPGRYEEVNILGEGKRNGERVWIIGECKTQIKKRDIDNFLKKVSRIEHLFPGKRLLLAVTYQTSPKIRDYIEQRGIKLYFSYQFGKAVENI